MDIRAEGLEEQEPYFPLLLGQYRDSVTVCLLALFFSRTGLFFLFTVSVFSPESSYILGISEFL